MSNEHELDDEALSAAAGGLHIRFADGPDPMGNGATPPNLGDFGQISNFSDHHIDNFH